MHEVLHGAYHVHDALFHRRGKGIVVEAQARSSRGVCLHIADPTVEYKRQRPTLRFRFHTEVAQQFTVGGQSLPLIALQAALRREVSIGNNEVAVHDMVADGLQQERLATAVFAHNEAERCAAIAHNVYVVKQSLYLTAPSYGNVRQTNAWHYATFKRIDNRLCDASGYLYHLLISFSTSSE